MLGFIEDSGCLELLGSVGTQTSARIKIFCPGITAKKKKQAEAVNKQKSKN